MKGGSMARRTAVRFLRILVRLPRLGWLITTATLTAQRAHHAPCSLDARAAWLHHHAGCALPLLPHLVNLLSKERILARVRFGRWTGPATDRKALAAGLRELVCGLQLD